MTDKELLEDLKSLKETHNDFYSDRNSVFKIMDLIKEWLDSTNEGKE